jgi:hypothetical protein
LWLNQETVHRLHLAILATMRPALDPAGHRVPRTKPTCLLHTWRAHRQRPFALVLHLHQHESSRNLHLQYLAKNQSTQHCQSLITQGSDHPPVSNHTWSSPIPLYLVSADWLVHVSLKGHRFSRRSLIFSIINQHVRLAGTPRYRPWSHVCCAWR